MESVLASEEICHLNNLKQINTKVCKQSNRLLTNSLVLGGLERKTQEKDFEGKHEKWMSNLGNN